MNTEYLFHHTGLMESVQQSLPIGNGEIGANIWASQDGLYLLLSRGDNWSELHRLLKTGLLRIQFPEKTFPKDTQFCLDMETGTLFISAGSLTLRIWADAHHPICHVEIQDVTPFCCEAKICNYREQEYVPDLRDNSNYHLMPNEGEEISGFVNRESADHTFAVEPSCIGQYHHNQYSCYSYTMDLQGLSGCTESQDPLLHRTFGFAVSGENMAVSEDKLSMEHPVTSLHLKISSYTGFCDEGEIKGELQKLLQLPSGDYEAHKQVWKFFWQKAFISATGSPWAEKMTQAFLLQRYMNFCAGKGKFPVKFNGSIFTCSTSPYDSRDYDYRMWGGPYWFQNTRLIYWNLLFSGDYELIPPFLSFYLELLPLAKYRTKTWFGHEGAFFPETTTIFGTHTCRDFGFDRTSTKKYEIKNPYVRYYYSGSLELCWFVIQYYKATGNQLAWEKMQELIYQVLLFFRNHFPVREEKLWISPSSSLETWHHCCNDAPTIAGLTVICRHLRDMDITPQTRELIHWIEPRLPSIPLSEKDGKKVLAPFEKNYDHQKMNVEAPELYPVFPYRLYGLTNPTSTEIAVQTYLGVQDKLHGGWQQYAIQAALSGLATEFRKETEYDLNAISQSVLFPAFWGPNFDEVPDQDNGNVLSLALIFSLVQYDDETIILLPCWNKSEDVCFQLPVGLGNTVSVVYRHGNYEKVEFFKEEYRTVIKRNPAFEEGTIKN